MGLSNGLGNELGLLSDSVSCFKVRTYTGHKWSKVGGNGEINKDLKIDNITLVKFSIFKVEMSLLTNNQTE